MYTLSVYLLGASTPVGFQFKDGMRGVLMAASLQKARESGRVDGKPEEIAIKDDYGRSAVLLMEEIAGWCGGDLAKSFEGQVDATLIQTRAQIDAQSRANADPKLRLAAAQAPGLIIGPRQ